MKEILIDSPKHGPHFIQVDDDDFERVSAMKWSLHVRQDCKHLKYATGLHGIYLHRFVLGIKRGEQADKLIDHKDGNGLNCQKNNLRTCSTSENQKNRKVPKNSTTGFKGVYMRKEKRYGENKFTSRIMVNGKRIELGCYKTPELAAIAYNNYASVHHGEFANLNIV